MREERTTPLRAQMIVWLAAFALIAASTLKIVSGMNSIFTGEYDLGTAYFLVALWETIVAWLMLSSPKQRLPAILGCLTYSAFFIYSACRYLYGLPDCSCLGPILTSTRTMAIFDAAMSASLGYAAYAGLPSEIAKYGKSIAFSLFMYGFLVCSIGGVSILGAGSILSLPDVYIGSFRPNGDVSVVSNGGRVLHGSLLFANPSLESIRILALQGGCGSVPNANFPVHIAPSKSVELKFGIREELAEASRIPLRLLVERGHELQSWRLSSVKAGESFWKRF